ncbi:MAG: hypothetical protein DRJ15_15935 [Bacteroidetes bacterium]|nr:MAG: hypothetical protein DRJ15_15935 [Bacteroidota bacterium]
MSSHLHNYELFNDSGCLSQIALEYYLENLLPVDKRKLVDEHLDSCLLCQDAVEGLKEMEGSHMSMSVEEPGIDGSGLGLSEKSASYSPGIDAHTSRINIRLRRRFRYHPPCKRAIRKGPFLGNLLIPAAATIIILMGIIAYFHFFFPDPHEMTMAEQKEIPLTMKEKEINKNAGETSVPLPETEQIVVGGIMKYSEDDMAEEAILLPATENNQDAGNESVDVIVIEDEIIEEEDVVPVETDDDISIVRPEVLDEAVVIHAVEEGAGGDVSREPKLSAKSRAKGDQKNESQKAVFTLTEQMPEFPGGMDSLQIFLQQTLVYPENIEPKIDTTVIAQFVISKKGKIKSIAIVKSAGKAFDNEVIRVIKLMPDWNPGMQKGKPVSVKYNLPIGFSSE